MSKNQIFRFGGIAAIISAVLYVISMALWMTAGTASSPPLATAAYLGSQLIFLVTLFALYTLHKDEAPAWILVASLLLLASVLVSLFIDPGDLGNPVVLLLTIAYGVAALILGWLALRSAQLTRPIAIAALLTGVLSLAMVPFILSGNSDLVGMLNLVLSVPYLAWLVLLGLHFLRSEAFAVEAN